MAYADAQGVLHAVSTDGKTDIAGPKFPDLTANGTAVVAAGLSADGHLFAYEGDTRTTVIDVTGHEATGALPGFAAIYNMFWSPDGSSLEADDNVGGIMIEHLPDGKVNSLATAATAAGVQAALGWIDATHLAVTLHPLQNSPGTAPTQGIGSLDITSGRVRTLATFSSPNLGTPHFSLAPDGTQALFFNQPFRNVAFTPKVAVIDTATGSVTSLPTITAVMGVDTFSSIAWQPATHRIAVSTGYKENGNLKTWLLDLGRDSAARLSVTDYPVGWTPNHGPLILSGGWQSDVNEGPIQLTAVTFAADGSTSATVLTKVAYTFTFLGFVRNSGA